MNELVVSVFRECYGLILCVAIIMSFLIANKEYSRQIVRFFSLLCTLSLIEAIAGTVERYLGNQETYYSARLVLSWLCYILAPALILVITEIMLRNDEKWIKWSVAIPEFINILFASSAFFGPWVFYFEKDLNKWHAGPLSIVTQSMPVIYLLILLLVAFAKVRKSKGECAIIIVSCFFIIMNYINEVYEFVPVNLRETTIAITLLAYFMYFTSIHHIDEVKEMNDAFAETEERFTKDMVDQSIETLSFTIDAKDKYTKGHSSRVAKYSRMIAEKEGMSEGKCRQVFLAGLLHDIGKISINDAIINKDGKLTDAEYAQIKQHPEKGAVILEKMKSIPYLQDGAKYHHERYDGKGYPAGLKGEDIPELARIIAVADSYDAMTSCRSYRKIMDQEVVKEEILKGVGTQFDPEFAKIMLTLIDDDKNYDMREKKEEMEKIS